MRVLIENCLTNLYLSLTGEWTSNDQEAMPFPNGNHALDFCLKNKIADAQIVLKFDSAQYDIKLPVSGECRDRQALERAAA